MKRPLSSTRRSISPPPLKRLKEQSNNSKIPDASLLISRLILAPAPTDSILTTYSWNVNSILPLLQKPIAFISPTTHPLRSFLACHHFPSLLCLQEVKLAPSDQKTQRHVSIAANSGNKANEPTYTVEFSLPRDRYNATGFGGKVHGVATLIRDDVLQRYKVATRTPHWDLEGRVLIHEFMNIPLVVINGYWVNGTANPYHNIKTGEVDGTRHDHKLRFHSHMLAMTKQYESAGNQVILIGDMNVAPTRIDGHPNLRTSPVQHVLNRADFNDKFLDVRTEDGLKGIDIFRHIHGPKKSYTYRGRNRPWGDSCDRVDLAIATRGLVEAGAVLDCDICDTPEERGHSDHVPLWIAIDLDKLNSSPDSEGVPRA